MKKIKDYLDKDIAIKCNTQEEWDNIVKLICQYKGSCNTTSKFNKINKNHLYLRNINIGGNNIGTGTKLTYVSSTIYPASDFLSNTHPFEVGKWYKSSRWVNIKAAKFLKIKDNGKFSYSERININGYEKVEGSTDTDRGAWDTFSEVPIEQIQSHLPKNKIMEENIDMLPYPNDNYFKAIVIKDIHRENISTKGNIPDFIPKGYKTWFTEVGGESWKDRILNKKSVVCPENNRWSTNIPSEYFEIVEETKSKFEVGKWYKYNNYIGKFAGEKDGLFTVSEYIHNNKFNDVKDYHNKWGKIDDYQKILLEDLSEIQEWLPDGHVDKIKTEIIPEYVECIKRTNIDNYNHLGKIYKVEYYNPYTGEIKILGKQISSIFFGEKSLIHRNNTDYKPSTKEAYEAQNKPKQLNVKDLIEGEIYFCKNSNFGNGNSGYIFLKIGSGSIKHIAIGNKDYSQTGWNFWTDVSSFDLRQATSEEKKWLNICIKQDKFIPKEDLHLYDDSGLLIPPQKCEECNDTGRVMKAKLYPSGHTEVWEDCEKCQEKESMFKKDDYIKHVDEILKVNVMKNIDFEIGDIVDYDGKKATILGFSKSLEHCVIEFEDISSGQKGNSGNNLEYWYDKNGNNIPYIYKDLGRYYVSITNLVKVKLRDNDEKRLLEEARKRYPIGTKFKCAEGGTECIVTEEQYEGFRYGYIAKDSIEAQGMYYVYYKGKWAEIIKVKSNMKEIQEECMRMFPIGCKYISAGSSNYPRILEKDTFTYTIKNNHVYTHEGGGVLFKGDTQQYAELISLPEEEEKGWIPQVGDWVVLISGDGKPNWSNDMKTYVGKCVQLLKKQGEKMYLIQEDNKNWSWEYSERTKHFRKALPHEISSNKINEYGLYVGYKLDANIITKWAKNINNYLYDGGWKKISGTFFGNRIIEKIDFKDGKPAFLVSGTMNIWLKAEGFREFDAHESLQEKEGFEGKKDFVDLSNKGIEVQIYKPGDKKTITTNINTITSIQEQLIKPKQTILF